MALGFIPAFANSILNAMCRATNITAPVGFFMKLHVGDPGGAATANPASNTTRQSITFGNAAAGGAIANTVAASWTSVPTSEDYSHFSVWDAVTAGTANSTGTITANPVTVGDTFSLAIGAVTLSLGVAA